MMIFNLFLTLFIVWEIQKLIQFNYFFRLSCLSSDYPKLITRRIKSVAYNETIKIALVEIVYTTITFIGIFSKNVYFFCGIFALTFFHVLIFKYIKQKKIRKISFVINIFLSIILLILPIINSLFYNQIDGILFIKQLATNICQIF